MTVCHLSDECVPLGCMMINGVGRLCPLLQPASVFSLPNAPSLVDLDWEESSSESGKAHLTDSRTCFIQQPLRATFNYIYATYASLHRKVNICSGGIISSFCQDLSLHRLRLILMPGVVFMSWIPAAGLEKCVWFTKTALQVLWSRLHNITFIN